VRGAAPVLLLSGVGITIAAVPTITCKIPEKMDAELESIIEKRAISKSEFVRQAIERELEEQKKAVELSAYDLMKEACGIIKGGPADLSTNPKHMKGFGRD
jgi:Arc/MetJ-type ribon-helix-helix transcriptional regulator